MMSDALGFRTTVPLSAGELLMGVQGYTQNFAVLAMMQVPGPMPPGYRRALKQLVYAAIVR